MIWALLAWFVLGGPGAGSGAILTSSGVEDLRDRVAVVVDDEARRRSAAATLGGLKKDVRAFERVYASSGRKLNDLYSDHETGRAAALAILDGLNSEWAEGQQRALDARFALRDGLTEAEWSALFPGRDQSAQSIGP